MSFDNLRNERLAREQEAAAAQNKLKQDEAERKLSILSEARKSHNIILSVLRKYGLNALSRILDEFQEAVGSDNPIFSVEYTIHSSKAPAEKRIFPFVTRVKSKALVEAFVAGKKNVDVLMYEELLKNDYPYGFSSTWFPKSDASRNFKEYQPCEVLLTEVFIGITRHSKLIVGGNDPIYDYMGVKILINSSGLTANDQPVGDPSEIYDIFINAEQNKQYSVNF